MMGARGERPTELSRQADALALAQELLDDIELSRLEPMAVARKVARLARLLDDAAAMQWLAYETTGYPTRGLDTEAWQAATRSCRVSETDDGPRATTLMVGEIAAEIGAAEINLRADFSGTSDSQAAIVVEREKAARRSALYTIITTRQGQLDRVVGAMHQYVGERYQELRFGSAVETAFQVVRQEVDAEIGGLVPGALPMITAAFENASSENPEHWQNAASTCRRLLMTAADRLRPPGPDVDGRRMGPGNYVNRLVNWVVSRAESDTAATMIAADLEFLGARLDAADGAGQKGAHVGPKPVTRLDVARYVTGTYLLLGDLLRTQSIKAPGVSQSATS